MSVARRIALVVLASAACEPYGENATSPAGAAADAGADAALLDDASDAGPRDGALANDGGPGCAAVFCDDFERTTTDEGWDVLSEEPAGLLSLDANFAQSGSRSVRVELPGGGPHAFLEKKFTTTSTHAALDFHLHMAKPGRVMQLGRLRIDTPDGRASNFFIQTKTNGSVIAGEQLYDGASYVGFVDRDVSAAFTPNQWQEWRLELDMSVRPAKGRVLVDGKLVREDALSNAFDPGVVRAYVGVSYAEDGPAFTAHLDDVAIDFR